MVESRRSRVGAVLALLAVLLALVVWFGSLPPDPGAGAHPGQDDLAADYDRYVGTEVVVSGTVVDADPVTVRADYGTGTLTLRITDVDADVAEGETLRVYGVARPDGEIRAENVVTVPPWGMPYAMVTSFLAGVWVLSRIVRHWRLDGEWALRRRTEPLPVPLVGTGDATADGTDAGGDDDA